jgi:hypothetical protein
MSVTFQMRVKISYYFEPRAGIDEDEIRTRFEDTVYPAMEAGLRKYRSPTIKLVRFLRKLKISEHDGWFHVYPKLAFELTATVLPQAQARVLMDVVLDDYVEAFKTGFPELIGYAYVYYSKYGVTTETLITA